jgi:alkanesulfonate monooxygenase SsuD/methylene tetrahydromethanopterin reductase-like flavin-dependent oxidoreductase (luciferase family)
LKWSIAINLRETVPEIVEKAILADTGGMDSVWITDYPAVRLSPILASMVARMTERIRIGIGLLSPFIYPSRQITQIMSTLIDHHGDRFDLLIGPGDKSRLEDIGVRLGKGASIVNKIAEALASIREDLKDFGGCSVFLAAQGQRMIETSRSADGVILNYSDPEMIKWAITALGSVSKTFEIGIFPPTLIIESNDQKKQFGVRASAGVVALGMNSYLRSRFHLREQLQPASTILKERGKIDEYVINQIDQDVSDRFCICEDLDGLCKRMRVFAESGVNLVVFGPPQGATLGGVKQLIQARKNCELLNARAQ